MSGYSAMLRTVNCMCVTSWKLSVGKYMQPSCKVGWTLLPSTIVGVDNVADIQKSVAGCQLSQFDFFQHWKKIIDVVWSGKSIVHSLQWACVSAQTLTSPCERSNRPINWLKFSLTHIIIYIYQSSYQSYIYTHTIIVSTCNAQPNLWKM